MIRPFPMRKVSLLPFPSPFCAESAHSRSLKATTLSFLFLILRQNVCLLRLSFVKKYEEWRKKPIIVWER